jgi:hypothetical protein
MQHPARWSRDAWAWVSRPSALGVGEARPPGAVACRLRGCPPLSLVGLGESGGSLVTAERLSAPRAAVWLLLLRVGLHGMRDPAPAPQGRALERVGEDSARDGWGRKQGESPLKGGRPLSEGDHVFLLPYALCLSTFQAPGWGIPAVFSPHRWRNATPWELVPFSHRSASRIFIMQPGCTPPPAVTQDGDLQLDDGGKRAGLRPLSLPQPQGFSSSRAREERVPSWGRPLRGRWPAPSLSDQREGRSSSVALAAAACLAFGREWLRSRSRHRRLPRQLEEVPPSTR